jgi:CoA:oxalate CoA-transferase
VGPLSGLRILAIEQLMAMPFGTQVLADFGADVVGVEPVGYGGDENVPWRLRTGRHKRRISVKLSAPEGQDLIRRLVPNFDVVVENYRPGVMDSYGLGWAALSQVNPRLVYASVSGYGHRDVLASPYADLAAYGPIGEAMSGYTYAAMQSEGGRSVGALGDITSSMFAAVGILVALRERDTSGRGAYVDVAMADALFALAELPFVMHTLSTDARPKAGGGAPSGVYMGGTVPAGDGHVTLIVINDRHWQRLCEIVGRPEWGTDPAYTAPDKRAAAGAQLRPLVAEWASSMTKHEAAAKLRAAGLACAPVMGPADILESDHFEARRMIQPVRQPDGSVVRVPGQPIKISTVVAQSGPNDEVIPIARPGQHTRGVLEADLGLGDNEVDDLLAAGIIAE